MRLKKWIIGGVLLCFGLFTFANTKLIPWLYKIDFYYSSQHECFSEGYIKSLSENEHSYLTKHIDQALSSMSLKNEHEIAAALNDYLFQFLLRDHKSYNPIRVLEHQGANCGGCAYTMCAMLSECGIENRMVYMLDIPYQDSHCLVEARFKDGSKGLFDPTFGIYWFDQEKNTYLVMDDLKKKPSLASTKALQTTHPKRQSKEDTVQPFLSIDEHYHYLVQDELHLEEMFSTHSNADIEGDSLKAFQVIRFDHAPSVLGEKSCKNLASAIPSERNQDGKVICSIPLLGRSHSGQQLNVSHIYELKNLEKNQSYALTLYYFSSINSLISSAIVGGKFSDTTKLTRHDEIADFSPRLWQKLPERVPGRSRSLTLNFTPAESDVNVIVDNSGEMLLHAIAIEPI